MAYYRTSNMANFQFPQYVSGGLYLAAIRNNKAIYQRPRLTGCWNLAAQYVNNQLVCTDCLAGHLIGRVLTPITEAQFLEDNDGNRYTLQQLTQIDIKYEKKLQ